MLSSSDRLEILISHLEAGIDDAQSRIDLAPQSPFFDVERAVVMQGKTFLELLLGIALGEPEALPKNQPMEVM